MAAGSTLRIAWRNLGRNRKRTALALTAIAVAQLALLFTDGLMRGYTDSMLDAMTGPMLGHVQAHAPQWREERAMDLVLEDVDATVEAMHRVENVRTAAARIYAPALIARDREGHAVIALGVEPREETGHGGLLSSTNERPRGRGVLVGAALAETMGVRVGDELALVGQGADGSLANDLFTVRGLLTSPVDLVNRMAVVMTLDAAQETFAMPDQAHEITIRGRDAETAGGLAATIRQDPHLEDAEVLPWKELAPELVTMIEMSASYSGVVLLLVFIAAAAGVANTMLMATFERKREIGMLLSLGTTPGRIVRMIMAEAVTLGLVGVLIGSVLGIALVGITSHTGFNWASVSSEEVGNLAYMGLNFEMDIFPRLAAADIVQGVVAVIVTSLLASVWPAITTSRLEPAGALRS